MGEVVTSAYYVFVTDSPSGAAVMLKVHQMGGKWRWRPVGVAQGDTAPYCFDYTHMHILVIG
jgi:hypothetical protein